MFLWVQVTNKEIEASRSGGNACPSGRGGEGSVSPRRSPDLYAVGPRTTRACGTEAKRCALRSCPWFRSLWSPRGSQGQGAIPSTLTAQSTACVLCGNAENRLLPQDRGSIPEAWLRGKKMHTRTQKVWTLPLDTRDFLGGPGQSIGSVLSNMSSTPTMY